MVRQDYEGAEKYFDQYAASPDPWQRKLTEDVRLVLPLHRGQLRKTRELFLGKLSAFKGVQLSSDPRENTLAINALTEIISGFLANIAYEMGDYPAMVQEADRAFNHTTRSPEDVFYDRDLRSWAYARNGNIAMSSKFMMELDHDVDKNQVLQLARYDYTAALIEYEQGKYEAAALRFDKAFQSLYPNHAPQLFYGISLLKSARISDAILELRRATWLFGVGVFGPTDVASTLCTFVYFPIGTVKAHYWLGVAYEQQGQKDQAIKEYETFLDIWKDADFKSKELNDAKARLSKLKGMASK
jgi:tetratricopeptide (TPR) repeat protein